jgi:pectin methylesterase-like acyl-CoA thioesterase
MATINPQNASGSTVSFGAASAGGDTFAFGTASRPVILVNNTSAGSVTVTLAGVNPCSQNFLHNTVVTCPVGITEITPPASAISAAGNVGVTYSAVTSVTVGAVSS